MPDLLKQGPSPVERRPMPELQKQEQKLKRRKHIDNEGATLVGNVQATSGARFLIGLKCSLQRLIALSVPMAGPGDI